MPESKSYQQILTGLTLETEDSSLFTLLQMRNGASSALKWVSTFGSRVILKRKVQRSPETIPKEQKNNSATVVNASYLH